MYASLEICLYLPIPLLYSNNMGHGINLYLSIIIQFWHLIQLYITMI